jgi:hypothetical protein
VKLRRYKGRTNMNSVIKRVLNNDWASLQKDIEKMAADRVTARVEEKKIEVLSRLNNVSPDKMKEIISVSN